MKRLGGGARKKDKRTLDIYKKKKKVVILSTRNKDLEMPMAGRQRGYCKNIFPMQIKYCHASLLQSKRI